MVLQGLQRVSVRAPRASRDTFHSNIVNCVILIDFLDPILLNGTKHQLWFRLGVLCWSQCERKVSVEFLEHSPGMILWKFAFSRHFSGDTCADQEHGSQLCPGQGATRAEEDTRQKTVEEGWIFGWEGRWDTSSL